MVLHQQPLGLVLFLDFAVMCNLEILYSAFHAGYLHPECQNPSESGLMSCSREKKAIQSLIQDSPLLIQTCFLSPILRHLWVKIQCASCRGSISQPPRGNSGAQRGLLTHTERPIKRVAQVGTHTTYEHEAAPNCHEEIISPILASLTENRIIHPQYCVRQRFAKTKLCGVVATRISSSQSTQHDSVAEER